MTSALKIPLSVVGATATAGAGVFAVKGFSSPKMEEYKETISSLLSQDRSKRAIVSGEDSDWTRVWTAYKDSKKDVDVPESFKTSCKNKLSSKVSGKDSEEYGNFLSYCVRDTLISDLIKDGGQILLSKTEGPETQGWKDAWKRYIDANREKSRDDAWVIADFETKKGQTNENAPDDFRTKCEDELGSKDIFNNTLFGQVKSWCTKV